MLAKYIARRLLASVVVVLGVTLITLLLMDRTRNPHRHGRGGSSRGDRRTPPRQQDRPRPDGGLRRRLRGAAVLDGPDAHPHLLRDPRAARASLASVERRVQPIQRRRRP